MSGMAKSLFLTVVFCAFFHGKALAQPMDHGNSAELSGVHGYGTLEQYIPVAPPGVEFTFLSLLTGIPYGLLALVPIIGNIVVLGGDIDKGVLLGWGIAGLAMGGIGLIGGLALMGHFINISSDGRGVPYVLPHLLLATIAVSLGAVNLTMALQKGPKRSKLSFIPYIAPGMNRDVVVGAGVFWKL